MWKYTLLKLGISVTNPVVAFPCRYIVCAVLPDLGFLMYSYGPILRSELSVAVK